MKSKKYINLGNCTILSYKNIHLSTSSSSPRPFPYLSFKVLHHFFHLYEQRDSPRSLHREWRLKSWEKLHGAVTQARVTITPRSNLLDRSLHVQKYTATDFKASQSFFHDLSYSRMWRTNFSNPQTVKLQRVKFSFNHKYHAYRNCKK